ncbi:hypothetical protein WICPIJ_006642 [Wickerhamomyces pijperi]|uniref:Uncharacterized protein n=1 Tax=Wickerhamomyces pijperi TaxID=599730 RepID=A0A9P8Q1A9_WICPI|nr:hypothetical protein WICPIJ_006642 [Wickerhamomyces pijperi]
MEAVPDNVERLVEDGTDGLLNEFGFAIGVFMLTGAMFGVTGVFDVLLEDVFDEDPLYLRSQSYYYCYYCCLEVGLAAEEKVSDSAVDFAEQGAAVGPVVETQACCIIVDQKSSFNKKVLLAND